MSHYACLCYVMEICYVLPKEDGVSLKQHPSSAEKPLVDSLVMLLSLSSEAVDKQSQDIQAISVRYSRETRCKTAPL